MHFLEDFGQKSDFWVKTVFPGQEVHYYMVYIAYFTELILQICDYAQKRCIWREIVNMGLTKIFIAIFGPDERLPSSATLGTTVLRAFKSVSEFLKKRKTPEQWYQAV